MKEKKKLGFTDGLRDGIPIGLGYLSVSFGFGISAVNNGLSVLSAVLISLTNLTSAGQVAGLAIIVTGGTLTEMALAQLIINMRYALMSISLSQRMNSSFTVPKRLMVAFGITDEIFAVASGQDKTLQPGYMYGLMMLPVLCWNMGTFLGGAAGELLPARLKAALGIAIYGMFIAICIPPARKSLNVLLAVAISAALSCCIRYIPVFSGISQGFSIIICTVIAAVMCSVFFPVKRNDGEVEQ